MNANITVLKDESLSVAGRVIEREYREVKRKACVGERIKIVDADSSYEVGTLFTVEDADFAWGGGGRGRDGSGVGVDGGEPLFHGRYITLEPTDIVRINGERLRMVDRKAAVGERVIVVNPESDADEFGGYKTGDAAVVTSIDYDGFGTFYKAEKEGGGYVTVYAKEYRVLEPVESAPVSDPLSAKPALDQAAELIAKLTTRVASLERRVTMLEVANAKPIPRRVTQERPSVTVAEVTADLAQRAKEARQRKRDDIVKRAKEDVAKLIADARGDNIGAWESIPALVDAGHGTIKFAVDRQKRKVTALAFLRYASNGNIPEFTGRSFCAPGDVFNSHIGRAIALRRALGLEIPEEYVSAPQPTEVRIGDIVTYDRVREYGTEYRVLSLGDGANLIISADEDEDMVGEYAYGGDDVADGAQILDDSRTDSAEPRKEAA
jgi:hypothetical protein